MTRVVELPGIGTLSEGSYGELVSEPFAIAALGGSRCRFVFDGIEGDLHPGDFAQAAQNFIAAERALLADATQYVHQYCMDMQRLWGPEAPALEIFQPADVWRYVDFGNELSVSRDDGAGRDAFVSLECSCAWEVEHGLQLVFRNGCEICKVGPYDGHLTNASAYADPRLKGVVYKRLGG